MSNIKNATHIPVDLLRKYDRPGPRYTSYPTVPVWSDKVGDKEYRSALKAASAKESDSIAVYSHIPFCRKRCFYCGCNTCIVKDVQATKPYVDALINEIRQTAALLRPRKGMSQLHFGGGTPTFLDIEGLGQILDTLESEFDAIDGCEKSIEIDPRVTSLEQVDFLVERGFNRVSLGVQDFDLEVQQASGRIQSEDLVARMLEHCRKLNFRGINFDLIYGLPLQSPQKFSHTLDQTIALRPDRLAIYSFAYLPNLKSNQARIKAEDLPPAEIKYHLFAIAVEKLTAAGYLQIGMDHFALPEDELSVAQGDGRLQRNFMGYTVQSSADMIGLGMSSIGYVDNCFFQNLAQIADYQNRMNENQFSVYRGLQLSEEDLIRQHVITSLMCNFHLDYSTLQTRFELDYKKHFEAEHSRLTDFFEDGFLTESESSLSVTELGRTFVRNIAMTYDAYLTDGKSSGKATFSRTI
ncbi:MAG: oxygen-independent coproporphyrinogen III oxidase [candidate division Zixibacteria bacterium]